MSSPFPLLRLPRLVLFEVFKSLSIDEKIKLSFCSKKVSTQINNACLYSHKVIVVLDMIDNTIEIRSENKKDTFGIFICSDCGTNKNPHIQQYRIEGHIVPVISSRIRITTFWKNDREGFLIVIQHLLKMFQCKISTSLKCHHSDLYRPIIFELFDQQLEFETITIPLNGSEDEHLFNQISNKFGLVKDLFISSFHDAAPVFASWPLTISIMKSAWFTLEYLLACTCTTITLRWSHLGNKDLNEMLKKWKTGGFPNLEYLYVYSHDITNNGTTILGMNLEELAGKVIQTEDGSKKANIKIYSGSYEMSVISS